MKRWHIGKTGFYWITAHLDADVLHSVRKVVAGFTGWNIIFQHIMWLERTLDLPISASVVDGQLLCDALLRFKSIPVHLWLLQRAHLLLFAPNTIQDIGHACRPLHAANTKGCTIWGHFKLHIRASTPGVLDKKCVCFWRNLRLAHQTQLITEKWKNMGRNNELWVSTAVLSACM